MPEAEIPEVNDLQEVKAMLAERVVKWTKEWKEEGVKEGRKDTPKTPHNVLED
ncbi:hypothetical protein [Candidatus Electrothrix sp.]